MTKAFHFAEDNIGDLDPFIPHISTTHLVNYSTPENMEVDCPDAKPP